LYAVENPTVKATYSARDPLLPFQFVETNATGQLKTTNDRTVLNQKVYYCLLVESLDSGETRTMEEEGAKDNEIQSEDDTPQVSTRTGRRSARNKYSNFVFY